MSGITTVTFDLWQTLLLDNQELGRVRAQARLDGAQQAMAAAGEIFDMEQIRDAYRACYQRCRQIREQLLDVGFDEQVEIFVNNVNPGLAARLGPETMREITRIYADSFLDYPPPAHADALAALHGVKEMGLNIGLISNTGMTPGTTFRTYLANKGMLEYFDVLTFSDEVKLSKPGSEIFMMTLRSLGAAPAETVHVGDHVKNDVVGAKRCGLKTIWITGFSEREDPDDPATEPDVAMEGLVGVAPAIAKLAERR